MQIKNKIKLERELALNPVIETPIFVKSCISVIYQTLQVFSMYLLSVSEFEGWPRSFKPLMLYLEAFFLVLHEVKPERNFLHAFITMYMLLYSNFLDIYHARMI